MNWDNYMFLSSMQLNPCMIHNFLDFDYMMKLLKYERWIYEDMHVSLWIVVVKGFLTYEVIVKGFAHINDSQGWKVFSPRIGYNEF